MPLSEAHTGGCQCGAVRFRVTQVGEFSICHCRMCQKASGNLFAGLVAVPYEHLTWTRGTPAEFMSSDMAERGFCQQCGTPLYYRFVGGDHNSLTIGAFDRPHDLPLVLQYGMEGRHPSMDHVNEVEVSGETEDDMSEYVERIRASNHQHPDHDTAIWPPQ